MIEKHGEQMLAPVLQKTETYHAEKIKGQKLSYCVLKKRIAGGFFHFGSAVQKKSSPE
jgi:hypothetical protein